MPDDKTAAPIRPRSARVKIADVAAAAGVHPSTVSRVLRADRTGRVSPDVAARIRAVAHDLGYSANPLAAGMRTRSTRSVGVIVHDISDPVYPPILRGIERRMGQAGHMVVLGNTGYDPAAELAMLDQMAARMMDGVILGTTRRDDPVVARARGLGLPVVSVLRRTDAGLCSAVANDCAAGMRAMAQAVLEHGHRDIALIGAPQDLSTARDRHEGVTGALAAHGCPVPDDRIAFVPRMDVVQGRLAMQALLARRARPPEAVIAVNDLVALGAVQACRDAGLDCPREISVTGYNDIPLLAMFDPPLASVAMDLTGIGAQAADLLLAHLADPALGPQLQIVPPVLRLRASLARRG
jgi:LacI family transcriptional regulator